ncbi:MAG: hypothetical protein MJZ38_06000 [archaeon]|nr:hypothetical protein [archaeon]
MDEVNPMAEMGFVHDKQVIVEAQGFLTPSNTIRDLAVEFIENGGKVYDLIDRYDNVVTYVLNRDNLGNDSDSSKLIAPFLKASGASDYTVQKFYSERLPLLPGAKDVMEYFLNTQPTFVDSRMYYHAALALCEKLNIPPEMVTSTNLELDPVELPYRTRMEVQAMAREISKLKISKTKYELNVPIGLDDDEVAMINTLDDIFLKRLQKNECMEILQTMSTIGPNEKAYGLLDIRKNTQVDLDGTVYIGGELIDFQVMDLVKDGNGLSMSFNGTEFAVHGCNVAVLSEDCTVSAVLVAKFYDTGIQGVFDLIENWNRKYLEKTDFPDRNLLNEMLRRHPRKLPEVYRVTRDNVDEIAAKSDAFRNKLFKKYRKETAA